MFVKKKFKQGVFLAAVAATVIVYVSMSSQAGNRDLIDLKVGDFTTMQDCTQQSIALDVAQDATLSLVAFANTDGVCTDVTVTITDETSDTSESFDSIGSEGFSTIRTLSAGKYTISVNNPGIEYDEIYFEALDYSGFYTQSATEE